MGGQIPHPSRIHTRIQTHAHCDTRTHICSRIETHMRTQAHTHTHVPWFCFKCCRPGAHLPLAQLLPRSHTRARTHTEYTQQRITVTHASIHLYLLYTSCSWHAKYKIHHHSRITQAHTHRQINVFKRICNTDTHTSIRTNMVFYVGSYSVLYVSACFLHAHNENIKAFSWKASSTGNLPAEAYRSA